MLAGNAGVTNTIVATGGTNEFQGWTHFGETGAGECLFSIDGDAPYIAMKGNENCFYANSILRFAFSETGTVARLEVRGSKLIVEPGADLVIDLGAMDPTNVPPSAGWTMLVSAVFPANSVQGAWDNVTLLGDPAVVARHAVAYNAGFNSNDVVLVRLEAPSDPYAAWSNAYGLAQGPGGDDDGDGLSNLYEYGLNGNPTNAADTGIPPTYGLDAAGPTNWFQYVHPMRNTDSGLAYFLEVSDDLVAGGWTNAYYEVAGTGATAYAEFDAVTNLVPTENDQRFIRLVIEQQ